MNLWLPIKKHNCEGTHDTPRREIFTNDGD